MTSLEEVKTLKDYMRVHQGEVISHPEKTNKCSDM